MIYVKESELHTKRTGHTNFVDKTLEAAKPISLEVPKATAESDQAGNASTSQPEGGTSSQCIEYFVNNSDLDVEISLTYNITSNVLGSILQAW